MREIVHIQGGQCGNQIGAKFWEVRQTVAKSSTVPSRLKRQSLKRQCSTVDTSLDLPLILLSLVNYFLCSCFRLCPMSTESIQRVSYRVAGVRQSLLNGMSVIFFLESSNARLLSKFCVAPCLPPPALSSHARNVPWRFRLAVRANQCLL